MKTLDNISLKLDNSFKNKGKLAVAFASIAAAMLTVSCRDQVATVSNPVPARPSSEAIAEAEGLYGGREDLTKVREGVIALRQAMANDSSNYDLAWRLAKFNYYLGAHTQNTNEQESAFREGILAGKLAVKLQDGKPDGHFWLAANYGGSAQASTLAGLSEFDDIKSEMEKVLKIDEGYQSGSAYMVLGQLYLQAPRLLGGDTQKAIENLEKGLKFGPDNALIRSHLANAYHDAGRDDEARKQIAALMAMKPAAGFEPEYKEAVADVQKLQEKMKT